MPPLPPWLVGWPGGQGTPTTTPTTAKGPAPRHGPPTRQPAPSAQGGGSSSGGGGQPGGAPDANPELLTRGTGPEPEWIVRDFTPGIHCNPTRDAIGEQDCWWMENLQPLASGYLKIIGQLGTPTNFNVGESLPYYITECSIGGQPYMFTAHPSGSAYIWPLTGGAPTKIMNALLNGIQETYVVTYNGSARQGILIIDPNGYWDYNITVAATLTKIGATVGQSIATYAGRVWIGNNNTVSFTDVNSYNSFAGAGGSATFSDQYLIAGITCLYAANNYLYIFGTVSVDVLSNVTVNAGVTSFSRVNVLQGLGVTFNNVMTVIGYGRGVAFLDITGFYLLAGATPERISERIQGAMRVADLTGYRNSAGLANINQELCLLLQVKLVGDTFSIPPGPGQYNRTVQFIYQRHRWWVYSTTFGNNLAQGPISGLPNFTGSFGAYTIVQSGGAGHLALLNLPNGSTGGASTSTPYNVGWQLRTKLWDGGRAFTEKQGINVGFSAQWYNGGPITATGVSFTIDTEFGSSSLLTLPNLSATFFGGSGGSPPFGFPGAYALDVYRGAGAAQNWGSQFIGLSFSGDGTVQNIIECIAMRGKQERNMLE